MPWEEGQEWFLEELAWKDRQQLDMGVQRCGSLCRVWGCPLSACSLNPATASTTALASSFPALDLAPHWLLLSLGFRG